MDPTPSAALRHCPQCRASTAAAHCPADGTATFRLQGIDVLGAARLDAGQLFAGRYRVLRRLGRGGFGAVYEAEHTGSGQRLALKVLAIDPDDAGEDVFFRFFREARVTASLKHPNTVRLYDFGQSDDGALYMAMELLQGPTLEKLLRDQRDAGQVLTERQAIDLAIPILRSLQEAHGAGLVHRDLKPDNLILADVGGDEPAVKVLDFGIARSEESKMTAANKVVGTPAYMSPEQCRGGAALDGRSDLYALGCILFRCVTGETPFTGDMLRMLRAQADEAPPDVRAVARTEISEGFASVVMRALAKRPDERFADAREMRQTLEVLAGGAWAGTPMPMPADAAIRTPAPLPSLAMPARTPPPAPRPPSAEMPAPRTAVLPDAELGADPGATVSQTAVLAEGEPGDEPGVTLQMGGLAAARPAEVPAPTLVGAGGLATAAAAPRPGGRTGVVVGAVVAAAALAAAAWWWSGQQAHGGEAPAAAAAVPAMAGMAPAAAGAQPAMPAVAAPAPEVGAVPQGKAVPKVEAEAEPKVEARPEPKAAAPVVAVPAAPVAEAAAAPGRKKAAPAKARVRAPAKAQGYEVID